MLANATSTIDSLDTSTSGKNSGEDNHALNIVRLRVSEICPRDKVFKRLSRSTEGTI